MAVPFPDSRCMNDPEGHKKERRGSEKYLKAKADEQSVPLAKKTKTLNNRVLVTHLVYMEQDEHCFGTGRSVDRLDLKAIVVPGKDAVSFPQW